MGDCDDMFSHAQIAQRKQFGHAGIGGVRLACPHHFAVQINRDVAGNRHQINSAGIAVQIQGDFELVARRHCDIARRGIITIFFQADLIYAGTQLPELHRGIRILFVIHKNPRTGRRRGNLQRAGNDLKLHILQRSLLAAHHCHDLFQSNVTVSGDFQIVFALLDPLGEGSASHHSTVQGNGRPGGIGGNLQCADIGSEVRLNLNRAPVFVHFPRNGPLRITALGKLCGIFPVRQVFDHQRSLADLFTLKNHRRRGRNTGQHHGRGDRLQLRINLSVRPLLDFHPDQLRPVSGFLKFDDVSRREQRTMERRYAPLFSEQRHHRSRRRRCDIQFRFLHFRFLLQTSNSKEERQRKN